MFPTRQPYLDLARRNFLRRQRRGFSLVEAMVSTSIVAMTGTVLLLGVETSLRVTGESIEQTQANGLARQLINETLSWPYMGKGISPYQYPLSANSYESAGNGRERFNDTDDFNGFVAQPAEDTYGVELGQGDGVGGLRHPNFRLPDRAMSRWRQSIRVFYVDESNPSVELPAGATSDARCVEVRIDYENADGSLRNITSLRRPYAFLQPPP